uniref:Uncharacterized protein n=1 Tax=Physcomitrium patens TaxID=3218 RepID=A0A2K1K253_PHYPA|nr:hypothetical protein PHYPA_012331 [Physcomitrium patens]
MFTIGPTPNTRVMIGKLTESSMNLDRLVMYHGDSAIHKKVIKFVLECNKRGACECQCFHAQHKVFRNVDKAL